MYKNYAFHSSNFNDLSWRFSIKRTTQWANSRENNNEHPKHRALCVPWKNLLITALSSACVGFMALLIPKHSPLCVRPSHITYAHSLNCVNDSGHMLGKHTPRTPQWDEQILSFTPFGLFWAWFVLFGCCPNIAPVHTMAMGLKLWF